MQALFGELIGDWVHIEEAMIDFLDLLLYPDADAKLEINKKSRGFSPGQQIFRPLGSNGARVKVMSALLRFFPGNDRRKNDPSYEAVISEFQSLTNLRNDYLHGLWWTKANGAVYLQTENVEISIFNRKRPIPKKDFEIFLKRCSALRRTIDALELKEYRASDERRAELAKFRHR